MNLPHASLATLLLATAVSAQCFETNFGTSLGTGDDSLLAVTPMNITFPMGGVATSYTHVHPSTNGFLYLTNGAASGGTASGYSTVAATMVTNLRGTAGQPPRIAPYYRDLNLTVANNAGLFVNNTIAGKCVVTWVNAVHFGQTSPVFTVQAQLFSNGDVRFFYSGTTQNTAICPIVGISQGNAVADPGATNLSTATSGVSTSQIVYETFATLNTFDLQTTSILFAPNAGGGYDTTPSPCVPASNSNYGAGCTVVSATYYESFAANGFDLANRSIHMTPNGSGGYSMSPGSNTFFTHTVAGLALTDDSLASVPLPSAFTYPGGSTTTLSVCSNGFIWMQTNTSSDFSPTVPELFSNAARLCPAWADLVPDGATNTNNVFAEHDVASNKFYVTWLNVPTFAAGGTVTAQVELDLTSGDVEMRYATATVPASSIVAWTPGTPLSTVDAGNRDISATLGAGFSTSATELAALALAVSPAPVLGTTVNFTTSNIPASAAFGQLLLCAAQQVPPIDLAAVGINAPSCLVHVDLSTIFLSPALVGTPSVAIPVPLPPNPVLAGLAIFGQTVIVDLPSNPAGIITSNGVRSVLNSF